MSSVRVSIQQSTLIMASFMSDQLEQDLKRNRLVDEGKLSQAEADERADEWEKVRFSSNLSTTRRIICFVFSNK